MNEKESILMTKIEGLTACVYVIHARVCLLEDARKQKQPPATQPDRALFRLCAHCVKEMDNKFVNGISASKFATHGICRRHAKECLAEAGLTPEEAQHEVDVLKPEDFCPDLNEPA